MSRRDNRAGALPVAVIALVFACFAAICIMFMSMKDLKAQVGEYESQVQEMESRMAVLSDRETVTDATQPTTETGTTENSQTFAAAKGLFEDEWRGLKVAWYGDSLTELYYHCEYVNQYFGFEGFNCGISGTSVANLNEKSMCHPERMTMEGKAIPNDAEVIIIMAGTNDWAANVPLGDDRLSFDADGHLRVDNATFYGACHMMFYNLTKMYPDAYILVAGSPIAASNQLNLYNEQDLTSFEYGSALCHAASMWGIPSFNVGEMMGINVNNVDDASALMYEGIHFVDGGARMAAEVIIQEICKLKYFK